MSATEKTIRVALPALLVGGALLPVFALGDPAPVHGVQDEASEEGCLRCHEDVKGEIERSVQHEPAYEEDCQLCHDPHTGRFEHLLKQRERALCFTCHRDQRVAFQTGSIHTPVREGRCVVCHDAHGSEHAGLLVAEGNELCFGCHEPKREETRLATVHEPFVEGECSDCHAAHNSEHADQLVGPANSLCGLCHSADDADVIESHYEIPIAGTRCTSCHDAHASKDAGLLLPVAHEPFAEGSCEMCHALESDTPRLVRATGARLCSMCHKDYPRAKDTLVHDPVAQGDCSACHVPHASEAAGLLADGVEAGCLGCHADIGERLHSSKSAHPFSFEDGGSCTVCHQPHSSTEEYLLRAGAIRTCLVCHETQRHGHPLGDDRIDPRTGKPISCVTCHDPHGTEFSYQLRGEKTRGLCVECHKT